MMNDIGFPFLIKVTTMLNITFQMNLKGFGNFRKALLSLTSRQKFRKAIGEERNITNDGHPKVRTAADAQPRLTDLLFVHFTACSN